MANHISSESVGTRGRILRSGSHGLFLVVDAEQIETLEGFAPPVRSGWEKCFYPLQPVYDKASFGRYLARAGIRLVANTPTQPTEHSPNIARQ